MCISQTLKLWKRVGERSRRTELRVLRSTERRREVCTEEDPHILYRTRAGWLKWNDPKAVFYTSDALWIRGLERESSIGEGLSDRDDVLLYQIFVLN